MLKARGEQELLHLAPSKLRLFSMPGLSQVRAESMLTQIVHNSGGFKVRYPVIQTGCLLVID